MILYDPYVLIHDIIAYLVAFTSILNEVLYKLGFKRHLNVKKDLPTDLRGHVAVVTGGTRGIGLSTVQTLLTKGCFVFVASSQTEEKFPLLLQNIYDDLPKKDPETGIERGIARLHHLDLSSMDSVIKFIKAFKATKLNLNFLICNAGIMFAPRKLTVDGFESHLAVNYLGHCLLITELLPELRKGSTFVGTNSRIVSVASSTHHITRIKFEDIHSENKYSSSQAYAQSKLAQVMFTMKLSRVLSDCLQTTDIDCFSLHPGVIISELYEHVKLIKYFPFLIPFVRLVTRVSQTA